MDTLYHFIFSIIVGLAVGIHIKHRFRVLAGLAFVSVLVDIDHFLGLSSRGTFHNIFIMFLIPIILFFVAYAYENKESIKYQTYSLILLVMLMGHLVSDIMYGGAVKLFYPLSDTLYRAPEAVLLATTEFYSPIISGDGIILLIYGIILLSAVFVEDFIYIFEQKHKSMKKTLKEIRNKVIS